MANSLPEFEASGLLPPGIQACNASEFLDRFCDKSETRKVFRKAVVDILDFAASRNARYVFVGGSFVTAKPDPRDFDVVIAFRRREHIPVKGERLLISGSRLDIMFCSEDEPDLLDAFIHLLGNGRYGENPGTVQIQLSEPGERWVIQHEPDEATYEIVKRAYFNREIVNLVEPSGVLVTVHGLLSNAAWNAHVVPIASNQGWVVAPYIYGIETPDILVRPGKRADAVGRFRDWIFEVGETYCQSGARISVIAHSFGTYLVGSYLAGFQIPPVTFNTLILTGSILNESFDWDSCAGNKVGRVRNEIAPNDDWVRWMPEKPGNWLGMDALFGSSGTKGFKQSRILDQPTNSIFDHNNVIRRDVVTAQWMPYLNGYRHAAEEEMLNYFSQRHRGVSRELLPP